MTWHPAPQVPCDCGDCTGENPVHTPEPEPERPARLRECGVSGCVWCPFVDEHTTDTTPGGGDRLPALGTKGTT